MTSYLQGVWDFAGDVPSQDPGVGNVAGDDPVTALAISSQMADGTPTPELAGVVLGDHILLQEVADATNYAVVEVTADPVDHGTWLELPAVQLILAGSSGVHPNASILLGFDHPAVPAGGWPYATVAQLASALRIRVTTDNEAALQRCLEAAAEEIDADLDRIDPLPVPIPAAITGTNIARAVEWWKAADAAYGIIGFEDTGAIRAPRDGFARHASTLTPWKQQWGVA